MTTYNNAFAVSVLLWFAVYVNGDPSSCYYCNTDVDGTVCNDLFDTTTVRIQHCVNSTVSARDDTNGTYVCSTITYISNANNFVTIRGCSTKQDTQTPFCTTLGQQVAGSGVAGSYMRNFSCTECTTELCNYSSSASRFIPNLTSVILTCAMFMILANSLNVY